MSFLSVSIVPCEHGVALELRALASVVLVIEISFAVPSFTHVAAIEISQKGPSLAALTILTDFVCRLVRATG